MKSISPLNNTKEAVQILKDNADYVSRLLPKGEVGHETAVGVLASVEYLELLLHAQELVKS